MRKIHSIAGLVIAIFVAIHLFNHTFSIIGVERHIEIMTLVRPIYRNILVETILIIAVLVQIFSGIKLFNIRRKLAHNFFDKLQIWTGLYLAIFFAIHISAVFVGRFFLHLDTNFYFGVAGLNTFPFNLFFIPYYALAILSFFGHIASIHSKKMKHTIFGLPPNSQSLAILLLGLILTVSILYGLTNHFNGVELPPEYNILIGK
jgi:hypothetical protein